MKNTPANRPQDTTIRYINSVDFNARVEPFWYNIRKVRERLGWLSYLKHRFQQKRLLREINEKLSQRGVDPAQWDRRSGTCVCNMRIEKLGALHELRAYAREHLKATPLPHLLEHRDRGSIYLPLIFERPFAVAEGERTQTIGSSVRLNQELEEVDRSLRARESLNPDKMVPFMHADSKAVDLYESRQAHDPLFWAKFGYIVLKKLTDMSMSNTLPIIFA